MEKNNVIHALREMLREQLCCVGRIAARHQLPDDAVWEIAKGFDVLYQRARWQLEASSEDAVPASPYRAEPHPGITYLLEKLDREASTAGEAGGT